MNDEEQVPQARTPAAPADAGETPVEKLEALGVRGILRQLARDGQLIEVRCEMPPVLLLPGSLPLRVEIDGFRLGADRRPLSETQDARRSPHPRQRPARASACNQRDYIWRKKINALLGKRMSLEEIAEQLNVKKVPTIHGTNR